MITLYKRSKSGKIQTWAIDIQGDANEATMITYSGLHEGKLRENLKIVGPTNVMKSALNRAEKLVATKYTNKRLAGYCDSFDEAIDAQVPKSPMNALRVDYSNRDKVPLPCYGEVKLNGFCGWYDTMCPDYLMSRTLKKQDVVHIREEIQELIKGSYVRFVHFEIFCPGMRLTEISKAIKKPNEDTPRLQAHIFDVVTDDGLVPMDARVNARKVLFRMHPELDALVNVNSIHLKRQSEIINFYKIACDAKEEGIILRPWKDTYQFDNKTHRTTSLVKMKPVYSGEYKIHAITFLKTKEKVDGKDATYMLAEFHCEHEGNPFKVTPAMTHKERHQMFLDRVKVDDLGPVTIQYREISAYGVPQHAVAVGFRDDFYKEDVNN